MRDMKKHTTGTFQPEPELEPVSKLLATLLGFSISVAGLLFINWLSRNADAIERCLP